MIGELAIVRKQFLFKATMWRKSLVRLFCHEWNTKYMYDFQWWQECIAYLEMPKLCYASLKLSSELYVPTAGRKLKFPGAVWWRECTGHATCTFVVNFLSQEIPHFLYISWYGTGCNLLYNFLCTGQFTCPVLTLWYSSYGIFLYISFINTTLTMQCNFTNLWQIANGSDDCICCVIRSNCCKSKNDLVVSCLLLSQLVHLSFLSMTLCTGFAEFIVFAWEHFMKSFNACTWYVSG